MVYISEIPVKETKTLQKILVFVLVDYFYVLPHKHNYKEKVVKVIS